MAEREREFKNPFEDYQEGFKVFNYITKRLHADIEGPLKDNVYILLQTLAKHLSTDIDWSDSTVYTGTAGIALLYMRFMDNAFPDTRKSFLKDAMAYIEPIIPYLKKKCYSFLCGAPGTLAVASVLYHRKGMVKESIDLARRLENLEKEVCSPSSNCPDELMYGRAGYLYSLLFLRKHLPGPDEFREDAIKEVVATIIASGQRNAKRFKNVHKLPLYYEWHDKAYLGAAHGFCGIIYVLLQAKEYITQQQMDELIRPTIDFVLSLQLPSGNFPNTIYVLQDKLIHWCHGAPGVVHLLLLAHEVFSDEKYLEAAIKCSDVIWKRGLLQKGYGLCHGVSGNGYAQLRLFQVTREEKYLYRAVKFAEWCFDYGKHGCRTPDRPLSLFEGFAGTIYFLLDLLNPVYSSFPAYQLF